MLRCYLMPQRGRSVQGVAVCGLMLALALESRVFAQDRVLLNSISKVEIKGRSVEISGSRRPNFTTFALTDPPRLVIDIAEAVLAGVPSEQKIGDGTVTAIKTQSFGSESAAIARIVIGFEKELETDIVTSGTQLIVKLPLDAKEAVRVAAERLEAERAVKKKTEEEQRLETEKAKQKAEQDAKAKLEAERLEREEIGRLARAEAEKKRLEAESEQLAKIEADRLEKKRLADEQEAQRKTAEAERMAKLKAEREEQERLVREKRAQVERQRAEAAQKARLALEEKLEREKADREAKAQALKEAQANKRVQAEEKARLEREEKARLKREAEEKQRAKELAEIAKAEAKEAEAARKRQALADNERASEQKRAEAERQAAAERAAETTKRAEAEKQAERDRRQRELDAAVANTPPPEELAKGSSRITFVGFKQDNGIGRIFLRTSAPAKYSVGEDSHHNVVVTLENTRISLPNNQRMLDTSFFDTAVSLVRPEELEGDTVRVTISLKKRVGYRASQSGNELTVEFERPD